MQNLLIILQVIIQSYSHLPISQLFENNLSVTLFLITNFQTIKDFIITNLGISKAKQQLFLKSNNFLRHFDQQTCKNQKKSISIKQAFIYIAINHPKLLPLHKKLLYSSKIQSTKHRNYFVQDLICITKQQKVLDNIFELQQNRQKQSQQHEIKGFLIKIYFQQNICQQISNQVGLYLSINELFHSHIGLILSIHEINNNEQFLKLLQKSQKQFQQDNDQILSLSYYCRIFQALPFKITYDQIISFADIQNHFWGQTIRIEQGTDGILFWLLLNHFPLFFNEAVIPSENILKVSNSLKNLANKYQLKFTQQQYGHILLKSKNLIKEPMTNLAFTVVIINLKTVEYCKTLNIVFGSVFQIEIKRYCRKKNIQRDYQSCEKIDHDVDRLSQLLTQIQLQPLLISSNLIEEKKELERKSLAYNIKKLLFIKIAN